MQRVFAVIGLGAFGMQLCETLSSKGVKVIAVDRDLTAVEAVRGMVTQAVRLDAMEEDALKSLSLGEIDVAIVAIGDDVEASVLVTAILKEGQVPFVVARAVSPIHGRVLRKVGADQVINLEVDGGLRLAARLAAPDILDRIPISEDICLAEVQLPRAFAGRSVAELDVARKFRLQLVIVKRNHLDVDELGNPSKREEILQPDTALPLSPDDVLLVVGTNTDVDAFIEAGNGL